MKLYIIAIDPEAKDVETGALIVAGGLYELTINATPAQLRQGVEMMGGFFSAYGRVASHATMIEGLEKRAK